VNYLTFNSSLRRLLDNPDNKITTTTQELYQLSLLLNPKANDLVKKRVFELLKQGDYTFTAQKELEVLVGYLIRTAAFDLEHITYKALWSEQILDKGYWLSIAYQYDMDELVKEYEYVNHSSLLSNEQRFLAEGILYHLADNTIISVEHILDYLKSDFLIVQRAVLIYIENVSDKKVFKSALLEFFKQNKDDELLPQTAVLLKLILPKDYYTSLIQDKVQTIEPHFYYEEMISVLKKSLTSSSP
jgi:hypothetical protein